MEQLYSLNYMLKLIKSFCDNGTSDYMFIKHYNTLSLPEEDVAEIIDNAENEYCLLYYKYSKHQMLEPYQPFLGWIRRLYYEYFSEETPDEFLKNAGVYPMQMYSFAEYIRTGKADRIQDILVNELYYESKRVLEAIVNIYKYICEKVNVFIVIESLHLSNYSGVKAVHSIMNNRLQGRLRLVATYNESYNMLGYILPVWNEFVNEMEQHGYQYEWGEVDTGKAVDAQDFFIPKAENIEEYIEKARNMYFFICQQDAQYYLDVIYDKIKHGNLEATRNQYVRILQLMALTEIHCKEYSRALQICEYVAIIANEDNNDRLIYNYNYLCAMTQFGMEQLENKITGYVDRCRSIAQKWGDELADYKPQILQLMSDCNYWRDIYIDYYGTYVTDEMISLTEKFGFKNILAYIYIYCFSSDSKVLEDVANHKCKLWYFEKGVELATEVQNYELLVSAYTKNIIVFSRAAHYDYVSELMEKKIEAINIEKNLMRVIHAYNGMGYNASITEKYQKAEENFSASIDELLKLGNGEEIAITLYNSSLNKMLAREYAYASEDLMLLIKIMDMLGMHALPMADKARFYGMLGICSFYIGEDYRCCYCLDKIENYVGHLDYVDDENKYQYWVDALFMKYILTAMMNVADGKYDEAEKSFKEAGKIVEMDTEKKFFSYILYVQEMAKYYDLIGKEDERRAILTEGIAFCDKNGYRIRSASLMTELRKGREGARKGIILKRQATGEQILEVVSRIVLKKELAAREREISFLTIWNELLSRCKTADEVMPKTFNLLKNHFNFDGVFMLWVNGGDARIEYMDCPPKDDSVDNVTGRVRSFTSEHLQGLAKYFKNNRHAILINRVEKGFFEYKDVLDIMGPHQIVTLFAAPLYGNNGELYSVVIGYVEMRKYAMPNKYLLNEHDYTILKFACEQLHNAMERLNYVELIQRMNTQLSDMAVTDQLTSLYNRQGFEKMMHQWSGGMVAEKAVVYIDMDNFKYYNDTFGHDLGDYVLVQFAGILKDAVSGCGYAVRFGGDEFVIVLNNKNAYYAEDVVKGIFDKLNNQLIPNLQKKIGSNCVIPDNKKLSFSAGIADCRESDNIADVLNNADKALYSVKRNSKNGYLIWK